MNYTTIAVGVFALVYGIFILALRLRGKEAAFGKLALMKERFGPEAGSRIHFIGYVVLPLVLGAALVLAGLLGANIFRAGR
ncbi:MAG: hypothetical protein JXA15_09700 [Spirochaetales bacterium]|nr:hypothetical protein [Spirochaetales bacterium]